MSFDAFLVIPTGSGPAISGETVTDKYFASAFGKAAVIALSSFDFSAENPTTIGSASGGAGAGKAKFNELAITKKVDKSSPGLFAALATGGHFGSVQLYLRRSGADGKPYLAYEFQLVSVTKVDWTGSDGDDAPSEAVTFVYGALQVAYKTQNPDGSLGSATKTSWSQVTNSPATTDGLTATMA
jgi:type VI secretion system secreted protein Hcp